MLKGKKILISGVTGFIGSNLARKCLKDGALVNILSRTTSNKWRTRDLLEEINEYYVDILDFEKLRAIISKVKPEIIFHTATYGAYPFQKDVNKIIKTNIIGTSNLINACLKVGFDFFINTGSSSEYGLKNSPMCETDFLEPVNIYGATKAATTLFCQAKARSENLPIVTLRLFSPYGYYEASTRLIPSIIISCLKKEDPQLSSPESKRDFLFVEDVVSAYMKVVENKEKIAGKIFNIGFGRQSSIRDVVAAIIKLTDNKISPRWGNVYNPRKEPKMWQADISKAKTQLGWQPIYGLAKGLKKTLDWFIKNISLYEMK